jgi:hypothetical protein
MERAAPARAEDDAPRAALTPWIWTLLVLGLLAWHGWKTLHLFGDDRPWDNLLDNRPVVTGRHPLHLYHGHLGARSFRATLHSTCYDPAFQIGYPKTHVFDSGCRPAELFLFLAGGYDPAAYKIGLAVCCLLIPLLVLLACWGAELGAPATGLSVAAALLVWWGTPARQTLEAGDIDLLLAALAVLAHVGLLVRFDRAPGLLSWLGLVLTGCLGWFAHPVLFPMLLPLLLVYYLTTGARHKLLSWHVPLGLAELAGLAVNAYWLADWVRAWWLRAPLPNNENMLAHRTFATLWMAPQWGALTDRLVGAVLLGSAAVGVAVLNQTQHRVSARLLGLGTGGLWLLAILGIAWEPVGRLGTCDLMVPALWFAALPAAYAWVQAFRLLVWALRSPAWATVAACALLGGLGYAGSDLLAAVGRQCEDTPRLTLGLNPEREALVQALRQYTTPEARILWEDRRARADCSRWTVLLPLLTGRSFVGGLTPYGEIEHARAGLVDQELREKHLSLWSDAELEAYCRRYNIGWVVCRTSVSAARFRAWGGAVETATFADDGPVTLFTIANAPRSFALKGRATVVQMDSRTITLADVVPQDGEVVLSLHYQRGLRAVPERVQLDGEPDADDLIPFLRLRVERPVARVTISWQGY